jgi:hypothetical protein
MFDDIVAKLPNVAACITVGSIARQCTLTLLDGTGLSLLDPEVKLLPHPARNIMTTPERDRYIDASCQLVNMLSGQPIGLEDMKDISRVMDVSGGVVFLEMDAQEKIMIAQKEWERRSV